MQDHETERTSPPVQSPARRRIVTAAREHFFAHGFRGVTMDDLAAELAMSKKTLYAHFPSKQSLLEDVLLGKLQDIETEAARITSECSSDFLTGLHRLLVCIQRHTEEVRPPFLRDMQRESPDLFGMVEGRRREIIQRYFGMLLEEGRREGLIRKDIPVRLIIEIVLGAVHAIMNPPKIAELGLTPTTGFTAIITVILEGVLRPRGRAER
jgi:AcrR family transcriptional regulator